MNRHLSLALLATLLSASAAFAAPSLKGEITVNKAIVTIGDMFDDAGSFAGETGGYASVNTANYDAVVERIWRESRSYYLLGYRAPISDHRLHRIELKVTAPGLTVRARRVRDSAAQGGRSWGFFRTSAMQHAFSPQHLA